MQVATLEEQEQSHRHFLNVHPNNANLFMHSPILKSQHLNTITHLVDKLKCDTILFPCKQISLLQKVFHESSRLLESFFDRELLHFALTFFAHPSNIIKQKLQDKNTFLG